jgi:undecaprenyl-diphosphatase
LRTCRDDGGTPQDRRLLRAVSARTGRRLPATVSWLGERQRLWLLAAAGLTTAGRGRAAARGLAAVEISAPIADFALKPLVRRSRPSAADAAGGRPNGPPPRSSSFPSGHTVAAFAFASAVADELRSPPLTVALAAAATAVGVSRIATVRHWPTDVFLSASLGVAGGMATRHVPLPSARVPPGRNEHDRHVHRDKGHCNPGRSRRGRERRAELRGS